MTARLATTDSDFQKAADNLLAVGSPPTLRSGQTLRTLFERDEGAVCFDDVGGVITAHVERGSVGALEASAFCIWVGHIQGKPASWVPLIRVICEVSLERGTDKLPDGKPTPVYRIMDPESAIGKAMGTYASDVVETRKDGKLVLRTTISRILKALGEV